jgi:hypothetical protein
VTTTHVAGGYLLAKPGVRVPKRGLTASACLADMAPDWWAIEWVGTTYGEREERAARLGIQTKNVPSLVRWVTERFGETFRWPNVFTDVVHAREFFRQFGLADVHLMGIALPSDLVETFLEASAPPEQQPGYAPVGATGVHDVVSRMEPLASGGSRRGYEVLGYGEVGQFHSFRCNDLERDFEREFDARFNEWGLIDDAAIARRCAAYASLPTTSTSARDWHPWLVEEYPL